MKVSAALSSSPVVTPGRTLPSSSLSVRTRMSPAAAILSISSGDFLMIKSGCSRDSPERPLDLFLEAQRRQRRADVVVDLGRRTRPVEALEDPALVVESDERLGLGAVGLQALADRLGLVVVALEELEAVAVAHALVLGRVEV